MAVKKLSLPYQIDDVTLADGNCFPHAILQQCRRQEIRRSLTKFSKNITEENDPNVLRNAVHQFVESSTDPQILDFKQNYNMLVAPIDNKTWKAYWQQMLKDHTWADSVFIQSTAWFLNLDILITTTSSTKDHPFLTVCGHLKRFNGPCAGDTIVLGCKSNIHYQSLLPIVTRNVKATERKQPAL